MRRQPLTIGEVYRVVIRVPGVWNVPRESIMRFIGGDAEKASFSLRPLAGTQEIEWQYIESCEPSSLPVHEPRKVRS